MGLTERRLGEWQRSTEKKGEPKCPKMSGVKPDKYRLCTVTPCIERNRGESRIICSIFNLEFCFFPSFAYLGQIVELRPLSL